MCSQETTTLPLVLSPLVFTAAVCLASGFVTGGPVVVPLENVKGFRAAPPSFHKGVLRGPGQPRQARAPLFRPYFP